MGRKAVVILSAMALLAVAASTAIWHQNGAYGFNVIMRRGGTFWATMDATDKRLSLSMQLALQESVPAVQAGPLVWRQVEPGFDVADLPVLHDGREVDRIFLNRIDPRYFRLVARNAPTGDKGIDEWERALPNAVLIVNGSYYGKKGRPDTPFIF